MIAAQLRDNLPFLIVAAALAACMAVLLVAGPKLARHHAHRAAHIRGYVRRLIAGQWQYGLHDGHGHELPLGTAPTPADALNQLAERAGHLDTEEEL